MALDVWHGCLARGFAADAAHAAAWCSECAKRGVRTRATDVDHIVDHRGDWAMFTDRANLQSLCHSCHSRKTAAEIYRRRRENG